MLKIRKHKPMLMKSILSVGALAVFGAIIVWSTIHSPVESNHYTYYVSPGGDDNAPGTTKEQSLATIQQALQKAQPGDTIQLADGEYHQHVKTVRSGSKNAPITIQGSRDAIIFGSNENNRIIEINHSYIILDGFHINGQTGNGQQKEDFKDKLIYAIGTKPKKGVEGLKLHNLLLENAGGECVRLRYFARHNEISNSTIKNCGIHDFRFSGGGKNGEGIYIGTAPEQRSDGKNPTADPDISSENWVHHNVIETYGNECVDIKEAATKNLVEHNTCSHQRDPKSAGFDARGDYNIFRYNTATNNLGAGVRLGGDEENDGLHNDVYGNTLTLNNAGAMRVMRQPQGKICDNVVEQNGIGTDEESNVVDPTVKCN